jgi:hypothetical protein
MMFLETYLSHGVNLKKVGSYYRAPCPFHTETAASFFVYPDGGYHCFGCSAHGTYEKFLEIMGEDSKYRIEKLSDWSVPYDPTVDIFVARMEKRLLDVAKPLPNYEKIELYDSWDRTLLVEKNQQYSADTYPLKMLANLERLFCIMLADRNLKEEDTWISF